MAHDGQCDVETRARMERMLSLLRPSRGRCASVDQPARLGSAWAGGRARAGDCSKSDALIPLLLLFPASSI